jgi:hypothetical protein
MDDDFEEVSDEIVKAVDVVRPDNVFVFDEKKAEPK